MPGDKRFNTADWNEEEDLPNAGTLSEDSASHRPTNLERSADDDADSDGSNSGHTDDDHERDAFTDDGEDGTSANGKGKEREKIVQPLTPEALAAFEAAQQKAGIIYISRIPPGMRPQKLRHILSAYGEVGRTYMVPEDPRLAQMRKKRSNSKQVRYEEAWVEFADKKVARSVAGLLNAQPIGGKRGSPYRDDVWTMKYLPKFKWNMLSEQLMHDKAAHTARIRIELAQSKQEQEQYLKQVSLGKKLENRAKRKKKSSDAPEWSNVFQGPQKKPRVEPVSEAAIAQEGQLKEVLGQIF